MMRNALVCGLPSSGKTTYLAALHWCLQHATGESQLRLTKRTGDTTYIDAQATRWSTAMPLDKTVALTRKHVLWELEHGSSGSAFSMVVPDLSGETFVKIWSDRRWAKDFDEHVHECDSILLFLNVTERHLPVSLAEQSAITRALDAVAGTNPTGVGEASDEPEPQVDWAPEHCNRLVMLVDVLQMIHGARPELPVGVLLSAWDAVEDPESKPSEWLNSACPLLSQYLQANDIVHNVFGVSAQGCDYGDSDAASKMQATPPHDRPRVVSGDGREQDSGIAAPIEWIVKAVDAGD